MTTRIQGLAAKARGAFQKKNEGWVIDDEVSTLPDLIFNYELHTSGDDDACLRDDLADDVFEPRDSYLLSFVAETLSALAAYPTPEQAWRSIPDREHSGVQWLSNDPRRRMDYLTNAFRTGDQSKDTADALITVAFWMHRKDVFDRVVAVLEEVQYSDEDPLFTEAPSP